MKTSNINYKINILSVSLSANSYYNNSYYNSVSGRPSWIGTNGILYFDKDNRPFRKYNPSVIDIDDLEFNDE